MRVAAQGKKLSVSFLLAYMHERTYGRSDGSDVKTNTKISGIDGVTNFVTLIMDASLGDV